jgi:hypothetical protein
MAHSQTPVECANAIPLMEDPKGTRDTPEYGTSPRFWFFCYRGASWSIHLGAFEGHKCRNNMAEEIADLPDSIDHS